MKSKHPGKIAFVESGWQKQAIMFPDATLSLRAGCQRKSATIYHSALRR